MSSPSPVPRPVLGALALASVLALAACGGEQQERIGTAGAPAASGRVSLAPVTAEPVEDGNHAACDAREAAGLRVHPPESTESVVVPFPAEACTGPGVQQLEIQGFGA
jgi:hypothetical protein